MNKLLLLLLMVFSSQALAGNGFVYVDSKHDFDTTVERFQKILVKKGISPMAVIDHAANAQTVDKHMLPTKVIIFGNPKVGTPLMEAQDTVALDLPMRVLIKEKQDGSVQLVYRDPAGLQQDHGDLPDDLIKTMQKALAGLTAKAAN